ncbi:MAG: DNRLRE domain-containing protein [Aminipila sp.]
MLRCNMTPSQNVYISEFYPDENFVIAPYLYISRFGGEGEIYRSLMQFEFDLCCSNKIIPQVSTIKSAVLQLYVDRNEIASGQITMSVHRLYNAFSESFVTWNTQPVFSGEADATATISSGYMGNLEVDILDLVKGWHDGSIPNLGMALLGEENNNALVGFRSTRYPNSGYWPKLMINYVKGIQTIYSTESLAVPASGTIASTPIRLSGTKKEVTFLVKIITEFATIDGSVQISPNGVNYFGANDSIYNTLNFAVSTNQTGEWARILLSSQNGAATVEVTPVTWEGLA